MAYQVREYTRVIGRPIPASKGTGQRPFLVHLDFSGHIPFERAIEQSKGLIDRGQRITARYLIKGYDLESFSTQDQGDKTNAIYVSDGEPADLPARRLPPAEIAASLREAESRVTVSSQTVIQQSDPDDETTPSDMVQVIKDAQGNIVTVLGRISVEGDRWTFQPTVAGRKRSRAKTSTPEAAIPSWAAKLPGSETMPLEDFTEETGLKLSWVNKRLTPVAKDGF